MGNSKGKPKNNYDSPPKYIKEYDLIERGYANLIYINIIEYHNIETKLNSNRRNYFNYNIDTTNIINDKLNIWKNITQFTSLLLTNKCLDDEIIISFYFAAILNLDSFEEFIEFLHKYDRDLHKYHSTNNKKCVIL